MLPNKAGLYFLTYERLANLHKSRSNLLYMFAGPQRIWLENCATHSPSDGIWKLFWIKLKFWPIPAKIRKLWVMDGPVDITRLNKFQIKNWRSLVESCWLHPIRWSHRWALFTWAYLKRMPVWGPCLPAWRCTVVPDILHVGSPIMSVGTRWLHRHSSQFDICVSPQNEHCLRLGS